MAINISSGDLKHKVTFSRPVQSKNEEGGVENDSYEVVIITFAAVREISQGRVNEASATALLHSKDFYVRWSEDRDQITKDWLLTYKGQPWVIHEIERLEEQTRWIRFTAKMKSDG